MLTKKYLKGEISKEKMEDMFTGLTFIVSTCLLQATVCCMYFGATWQGCVMSSVVSLFVEVGGKFYAVWATKKSIDEWIKVVTKRSGAAAYRGALLASAEPGFREAFESGGALAEPENERLRASLVAHGVEAEREAKSEDEPWQGTVDQADNTRAPDEEGDPKEEDISKKDDDGEDEDEDEDENEDDLLTMKKWKTFLGNLAIRYHQEIICE